MRFRSYFVTLFFCCFLSDGAKPTLADDVSVGITVRQTSIATVQPGFLGLQYNGPTHLAINPQTGQSEDFPSAYATPSTQAALGAAGIGMVRVFVDVPQVHPSPGVFDWTDTDTAVAEIEASGMTPLLTLHQREGSWFVGSKQQPWWTEETGRQEWQTLATEIAQRYGAQTSYFELLNEPNHIHPTFSSYMGWDQSVDLFLDAAEAIHQAIPNAKVGGPASYGSWEPATWAKKVLARPNGEEQLNFVSYHIYTSKNVNDSNEDLFEMAKWYETAPAAIRSSLSALTNKPIELALTEFNSSSVWQINGTLYTDPRNVDHVGGLIASLGWLYSARAEVDKAFRFGTTGGFGLIQWPPDYELRDAYYAVRLLHEIAGLSDNTELLKIDLTGGPADEPADEVEFFALRNGMGDHAEESFIFINTSATESIEIAVQFDSGLAEGTLDLFRYDANRLANSLVPLAQLTGTDGIVQLTIPPLSMTVLREASTPVGLPGDFNNDGTVDAADYTVWRDAGLPQEDYNTWKANFGATTPASSTSTSSKNESLTIPEPTTFGLMALSFVLAATSGNRKRLGPRTVSKKDRSN